MNVISKAGLMDLLKGKSKDVQVEGLAWHQAARHAHWSSFEAVRKDFSDADIVNGLLVFDIRQNLLPPQTVRQGIAHTQGIR